MVFKKCGENVNNRIGLYQNCVLINAHYRTKYARMDQVKFVEDIL